jgi:hypothetical protein
VGTIDFAGTSRRLFSGHPVQAVYSQRVMSPGLGSVGEIAAYLLTTKFFATYSVFISETENVDGR